MGCSQSSTNKAQPANKEATQVRAFKLTVQRKDGEKLGVELGTTLDGKALMVLDVKPGLVMELNKTHQETQILPGDSIQSVNGIQGNTEAMKADLGSKDVLELVVAPFPKVAKKGGEVEVDKQPAPPTTETTVKLDNAKCETLGLKVSTADGTTLQVVEVLEGFCKSNNEGTPEAAIQVGDSIVALQMGEVRLEGDAVQLLIGLSKLGSGVLTLRRPTSEMPTEKKEEVAQPEDSKAEPVSTEQAAEPTAENPASEPVNGAAEEEKKDEIQPIQQPEEAEEAATTPVMVVETTEVRRGGLFGFCCAPAVEKAVE